MVWRSGSIISQEGKRKLPFRKNKEGSYASLVYGTSLDDAVSGHVDDLCGAGGGYLHQGAKKRLRMADGG